MNISINNVTHEHSQCAVNEFTGIRCSEMVTDAWVLVCVFTQLQERCFCSKGGFRARSTTDGRSKGICIILRPMETLGERRQAVLAPRQLWPLIMFADKPGVRDYLL